MKKHRCALTGNRDSRGLDEELLFATLEKAVLDGYDEFYDGMAIGFDLKALEALVKLKERFPIRIIACIPFRTQADSYSKENRRLYYSLLKHCDEFVILNEDFGRRTYLDRDRYMVDHADLVIAFSRKDTGGTVYTLRYAEKTGKEIVRI